MVFQYLGEDDYMNPGYLLYICRHARRGIFGYTRNTQNPWKCRHFKVDTGTNISVISKKYLAKLGFEQNQIIQNGELTENVDTSNGNTVNDCYLIILQQVRLVYTSAKTYYLSHL